MLNGGGNLAYITSRNRIRNLTTFGGSRIFKSILFHISQWTIPPQLIEKKSDKRFRWKRLFFFFKAEKRLFISYLSSRIDIPRDRTLKSRARCFYFDSIWIPKSRLWLTLQEERDSILSFFSNFSPTVGSRVSRSFLFFFLVCLTFASLLSRSRTPTFRQHRPLNSLWLSMRPDFWFWDGESTFSNSF